MPNTAALATTRVCIVERYSLETGRACPAYAPHCKRASMLYFTDYTLVRLGRTSSRACAAI
ncbi:hypothetical protein IG631_17674 [Alternaria alternata]|nr:hypothetical protein IG631_17674 [Alternaria alternata]